MKRVLYEYWLTLVRAIKSLVDPERKKALKQREESAALDRAADLELADFLKMEREEYERRAPELVPRQTALFMEYREKPVWNAGKYRRRLRKQCAELHGKGVTKFIVNYGVPYGLLALETLLALKQEGRTMDVYCFKELGQPRKSRRIIKEYGMETVLLAARCDYSFGAMPYDEVLERLFLHAGYLVNASGVHPLRAFE